MIRTAPNIWQMLNKVKYYQLEKLLNFHKQFSSTTVPLSPARPQSWTFTAHPLVLINICPTFFRQLFFPADVLTQANGKPNCPWRGRSALTSLQVGQATHTSLSLFPDTHLCRWTMEGPRMKVTEPPFTLSRGVTASEASPCDLICCKSSFLCATVLPGSF